MFLAEAVKEKDYLKESITKLCNRVKWLSITIDVSDAKLNKELVINKLEELDKLYKDYQKYKIIVTRAKAKIVLNLNDDEFSIADAENLVEVLEDKLLFFETLITTVEGSNSGPSNMVCVDLKNIDNDVTLLRSDIRAIEQSIERVLWSTEI